MHVRNVCHTSRATLASQPRGVAQLAERRSPKPGVAGSSPVAPVGSTRRNPASRALRLVGHSRELPLKTAQDRTKLRARNWRALVVASDDTSQHETDERRRDGWAIHLHRNPQAQRRQVRELPSPLEGTGRGGRVERAAHDRLQPVCERGRHRGQRRTGSSRRRVDDAAHAGHAPAHHRCIRQLARGDNGHAGVRATE